MLLSSLTTPDDTSVVLCAGAVQEEMIAIADWWLRNLADDSSGNFISEFDYFAAPIKNAPKGVVQTSRILWFFSSMAMEFPCPEYKAMADQAYSLLVNKFDDVEYGGAYWELSADYSRLKEVGKLNGANDKKQVYAQSFCIYALSAYYELTRSETALNRALNYFDLLEQHARDACYGGYIEALDRRWQPITDMRLSEKDMNVPKSMNTHLHILEAYTALYRVSGNTTVAQSLSHVLSVFDAHIIDHQAGHLRVFFDEKWNSQIKTHSFGHDIEASWLLCEAAQSLGNSELTAHFNAVSLALVKRNSEVALGQQGQVVEHSWVATQIGLQDSVWWVQAEALVAYLAAYQASAKTQYFEIAQGLWEFINQHHLDRSNGEWHWLVSQNTAAAKSHYKAGFWKGPYHNGRAMLEAHRRLSEIGELPCI